MTEPLRLNAAKVIDPMAFSDSRMPVTDARRKVWLANKKTRIELAIAKADEIIALTRAKIEADLYPPFGYPSYDAPQPESPDPLLVAIELLVAARSQVERGADKAGCDGRRSQEMCRQVIQLIDQAFAVLQFEQDDQ